MNEFFTISQVNRYLKNIIESEPFLGDITLRGEISNFKAHYSGHLYLTLKDETSSIKAVMFKSDAVRLKIRPEDGMKVLARCRIGVYEASGSYQAYIREMTADGIGDLHVAFEKLKAKLEGEGLFDASYKKPIPKFPEKIGVVTSSTGAAVQDICNVLGRRYPIGEVIIRSTQVQGEGSAEDIANAIRFFNRECPVDVLIVGRGGGSIEDLWAFNEEVVARAVFESEIPVISAVGHETDFTICDFVADLRAPTPSAAAELAATPVNEIKGNINWFESRLCSLMQEKIQKNRLRVQALGADKTLMRLKNNLEDKRNALGVLEEKLSVQVRRRVDSAKSFLAVTTAKLDGSSPLKIMSKGYCGIEKDEKPVKSARDLAVGDHTTLTLADGKLTAKITDIRIDK